MDELSNYLKEHAQGRLVSWQHQGEAARRYRITVAQAERTILEMGLLPARYQRNVGSLTAEGQLVLHRSRVAVIGCGGLGGYIVELLARVGIGTIVAVDPDVFEEHNLNRQLLSSIETLGMPKAAAAAQRVAAINPAVTVVPVQEAFATANAGDLIAGSSVAVDALDNVQDRLDLSDACNSHGVPLVHGAIAGWYGQVATQLPEQATLRHIYRSWGSGSGVERELGNPSFTPTAVASFQVAEVCKLLLGSGRLLAGRKLVIDLLHMDVDQFTIPV
ncbi:HesA/MoeB/ThiF family protein [Geomonas paludis]|uniref:HesA/MoeB/ThiF family protein n=1 Tax=Geomonas paludis TaxID=2740185 RepID=A0A6V8MV75_9BACT|nr:HesA/MoeB/ThiF family protein [Geomonas paludis]UPU34116.1 HesA/MoeB/ThiF family protein [Geomonas paludis]GFO64088.1 molybdopterin biosynthesis protein MoeB [Geomonas paludis]